MNIKYSDQTIACVCAKGHVFRDVANVHTDFTVNYCTCGAPIIHKCEHCGTNIRGVRAAEINGRIVRATQGYQPPDHCEHCGKPFSWKWRQRMRRAFAVAWKHFRLNMRNLAFLVSVIGNILQAYWSHLK